MNKLKINDIIHGFRVSSALESKELEGVLWKMEHIKTGAALAWLDNGEENKLFSVTLKTLPFDDTGVFHILEHSVLCGSEGFPVKEPFLDLLKGSMNTFLNAFTFPDKTMYPVSSRNEKDFLNLTRVYLDAVFCPAIYTNPCIFKQEGWHYELHRGEENPTYKGVVFNEMKGAYSSVEAVADSEICRLLFPDSCYGYSSGGDPESIPFLTYESFIASHREFYHPSNSRTYLDGDLPIKKVLELINSYFEKYERNPSKHDIAMQAPVKAQEATAYYEIGADEEEGEKTHLSFGKLLCSFEDKKKILASEILSTYLTASNASPLKRAILEDGLAQDAVLTINWGIAQAYSVLRIKNTEADRTEKIKEKVASVAKRLLCEGLDREELEAAINRMEYNIKVTEEPQGVERAISAMNGWLYGGEPEDYLMLEDTVAALRSALDTDYFSKLLTELLLDREYTSTLTVLPSKTKGEEARQKEAQRLASAAELWSGEEREKIIAQTEELEAWQTSEDTPDALATLPSLSISDINPDPEDIPSEISEENGIKFIFHKIASKGTVHARLYFNMGDIPTEKLPYTAFLAHMLGNLPTKHYTVAELKRQIRKYTGSLSFSVKTYECPTDKSLCRVYFSVDINVLSSNLGKAAEIAEEIIKNTCFDSKSQIKELLVQYAEGRQHTVVSQGHIFAARRALASFSAEAAIEEKLWGYDAYKALSLLSKSFDEKFSELYAFSLDFCKNVFVRERLTISETASEKQKEIISAASSLEKGIAAPQYMKAAISKECKKEAIEIPSAVSYAGMSVSLSAINEKYNGFMGVLRGLLSYGYLWNEIRVLGGAYGCGFAASTNGNISFRTFRDPTPLRSVDIFKKTSDFLCGFASGEESLDRYIISSISASDPLLSPEDKGNLADSRIFTDSTYEKRAENRRVLLSMTKQDLLSLCEIFDKTAQSASLCVIAHSGVISELDGEWTVYKL